MAIYLQKVINNLKLNPGEEYKYYMTLQDYIAEFDIDMAATEALDYLIEVIHIDLLAAVEVQDYPEANRLQEIIESLPLKQIED